MIHHGGDSCQASSCRNKSTSTDHPTMAPLLAAIIRLSFCSLLCIALQFLTSDRPTDNGTSVLIQATSDHGTSSLRRILSVESLSVISTDVESPMRHLRFKPNQSLHTTTRAHPAAGALFPATTGVDSRVHNWHRLDQQCILNVGSLPVSSTAAESHCTVPIS